MSGGPVFLLIVAGLMVLVLAGADREGAFRRAKPWHRWLPWLWYPSVLTVAIGIVWLLARDTTYSPAFRAISSLSWVVGALGLRFPRRADKGPHLRLPVVVQALILGLVFGSAIEFAVAHGGVDARQALILALSQAFAFYQDVGRWTYDRWLKRSEVPATAPR